MERSKNNKKEDRTGMGISKS